MKRHTKHSSQESDGFRTAWVFHRFATLVGATEADDSVFPADYYPLPVAVVASEDLMKVFQVTQFDGLLSPSDQNIVQWLAPSRSTSVGDVVILDYGSDNKQIYRYERRGWTLLA